MCPLAQKAASAEVGKDTKGSSQGCSSVTNNDGQQLSCPQETNVPCSSTFIIIIIIVIRSDFKSKGRFGGSLCTIACKKQ